MKNIFTSLVREKCAEPDAIAHHNDYYNFSVVFGKTTIFSFLKTQSVWLNMQKIENSRI